MQPPPTPPSLEWPILLVWAVVSLIAGGGGATIVVALINRRRTRAETDKTGAEGEESKARAQKTAGETFHQLLEDLTAANDRLQQQRDQNGALRDERDRYRTRLENCERKERRRLAQEAQKPRVLLVEDQDEMRSLALARFRNSPFKLEVARDGQDALEQYEDAIHLGFPFKVLVLDYSMPGMSGIEVGKKIRITGDQTTKFILWTAYPRQALEEDLDGIFAERERIVTTKEDIEELEREVLDALGLSKT